MTVKKMAPRDVFAAASALMKAGRGREAAEKYFSSDYIEHNPHVPGGDWEGFVRMDRNFDDFLRVMTNEDSSDASAPSEKLLEFHVHHVISEGDYVVVHQHLAKSGRPILVCMDIYRIQDGKIVEHWDVMQAPPRHPENTRHKMY